MLLKHSSGPNLLKPVPTQILTLSDSSGKTIPLGLDNGATVDVVTIDIAIAYNFVIKHNN